VHRVVLAHEPIVTPGASGGPVRDRAELPAHVNSNRRAARLRKEIEKRLEALLAEFEWRGGAPVERLRKELGL
jgi:hypothetical protein